MRTVGFSSTMQASVELANCEVKSARRGDKFEVMLKNGTKVKKSPKKFNT